MPLLYPLLLSHHRSFLPCQDGAIFTHIPGTAGEACRSLDSYTYECMNTSLHIQTIGSVNDPCKVFDVLDEFYWNVITTAGFGLTF